MSLWSLGLLLMATSISAEDSFDPSQHPEYHYNEGNPETLGGNPERWEFTSDSFRLPQRKVQWIMRTRKQIIWDVTVTTDANGWRVVPQAHIESRKQFFAVYGCSFTFGSGLNDDETLAYYLAKSLPASHVYNLAVPGSGPHQMLEMLLKKNLPSQLKEKQGTFLYVYIDAHIGRANGFLVESTWGKDGPYFDYDANGRLVRQGSFASAHPWRYKLYGQVWKWATKIGYFNFNFPPVLSRHIKYTCDLIAESKLEFESQFPGSKFLVVDHALASMRRELKECLNAAGVPVVALDSPVEVAARAALIPMDGHPSARFNSAFAEKIAEKIREIRGKL